MTTSDIDLSRDVAAALAAGHPIVALESTLFVHGMPYPDNLATAAALEALVSEGGAVPATIAVLAGRIRVGLGRLDLERLANSANVLKASTHDLAFAVAQRRDAATTVAATMRIAAMTGIRILATGGIGGVHRGARDSMDVSADITELGRTSVAVVCAGVKAILDVPATLEALETACVPVVSVGSDVFPAFYSRSSGLATPLRLDAPRDIATFLTAKWRLGIGGGALIATPIPVADEIPAGEISAAIEASLAEAAACGVVGKAVTPFLLDRVNTATGGRSLAANVALVKNNARLAAQIAGALA